MRKEIFKEVQVPEGVEIIVNGKIVTVKGKEGELTRRFEAKNVSFKKEGKNMKIGHERATKKEKKLINTVAAHVKNMVRGVQRKFEYKLKVCSSHFPITVEVQKGKVTVKNFLGEKIPRVSKLPKDAEVEVKGDIITVKALDVEVAGQASADLERVTNIINRDRRVFQDGIFITEKDGVKT